MKTRRHANIKMTGAGKTLIAGMTAILFLAAAVGPGMASQGVSTGFIALKAVSIPKPEEIPEASKADAAYNIGVKYYNGSGGHIAQAVEWFRNAADLGSAKGQYRLGVAYETGEGVKKSYKKAFKWYSLAAKQEDKEAECGLGGLYANGYGVKRDDAKAAKWYRLAAERDVARAQYGLGLLYLAGRGVRKDYAEAYLWLALGAKAIDSAMEKRDEAAKRLTPKQLEAVRLRFKNWQPATGTDSQD